MVTKTHCSDRIRQDRHLMAYQMIMGIHCWGDMSRQVWHLMAHLLQPIMGIVAPLVIRFTELLNNHTRSELRV